jgi:spermidine/putrescine transport system ATP-binding protein
VVGPLDLDIEAGDFFAILGPSGCGKTTFLRMLAGFVAPSGGKVRIGGADVTRLGPERRPTNMVFQSYGLFPHMTVRQNVAFGLTLRRRLARSEIRDRVDAMLALARLEALAERGVGQLSGGQQQRVALARSLVLNPSVLLLDEPLGALDAKLRKALQIELKALQEEIGITFIYVTHDQEEALTMSDRMAVMSHGKVEQLGTPAEVYESPASSYIAEFLGVSNLMEVMVKAATSNGEAVVQLGSHELVAATKYPWPGPALVSIRPERIKIMTGESDGPNIVPAIVDRTVYAGPILNLLVHVDDLNEIQVTVPNEGHMATYRHGDVLKIYMPAEAIQVLDRDEAVTA